MRGTNLLLTNGRAAAMGKHVDINVSFVGFLNYIFVRINSLQFL